MCFLSCMSLQPSWICCYLRKCCGFKVNNNTSLQLVLITFSPHVGREMTEVPGLYSSGEYDLAGFVVGAVERGQMLLGLQRADEDDVLIGLASSGIHGRGLSIVRKVLLMSSSRYSSPAPGSCGDKTLGMLSFFSKANLQMSCVQAFS